MFLNIRIERLPELEQFGSQRIFLVEDTQSKDDESGIECTIEKHRRHGLSIPFHVGGLVATLMQIGRSRNRNCFKLLLSFEKSKLSSMEVSSRSESCPSSQSKGRRLELGAVRMLRARPLWASAKLSAWSY